MWDALFSSFQIEGPITYPLYAKRELERYEQELNLRLPRSYREFCFVFGPGEIVPPFQFNIAAPGPDTWSSRSESRYLNDFAGGSFAANDGAEDIARLSRALYFASDISLRFYFWDTGEITSAQEGEYAIYVLERLGDIHRLADTYFDFIAKTCLVDGTPGDDPTAERDQEFEPAEGPFRPVTISSAWRTSTVIAIASEMSESRDFSAMPILADALQDAGCDHGALLETCRDPDSANLCGRWVVNLVLANE